MKKIQIISGVLWAVVCLVLILFLFPGYNKLSASAANLPFMKINPNYSGGELVREIPTGNYSIVIRKPVFSGLIHERRTGFVQVDWKGTLPGQLIDTIDYDLDGKPDFSLSINRDKRKTEISSLNPKVGSVRVSVPTSYGWAVRINLQK
jgi:hypothetical protein